MRRALVLLLLLAPLVGAEAQPDDAIERALAWLADAPNLPQAPYVVEAVAQAGLDPKRWPAPGLDAFARLDPYVDGENSYYYSYLRIAHAAGTSGYDPRDVNGIDHIQLIRDGFSGGQFGSATYVNDDIWAILALRAAGVPADDAQIRAAVLHVKARQLPDGGWAHAFPALQGATDVTGAALAALASAGEDMSAFSDARAFLDGTLHASGGHNDGVFDSVNCQSTVWAIHGYAALGVPARPDTMSYLRSLQTASGGLRTSLSSGSAQPDAWCTSEAIVVLAGARYPFPSFEPLAPPRPTAHARERATLSINGPFTSATWTFDDETVEGVSIERTFPRAGLHAYRLLAEGPGIRARVHANVEVLSARPLLGDFPANVTAHRHAPVSLDLRNASDPDGVVVRFEVAWGDGTWTNGSERLPTHAYALPGNYTLRTRAQDGAGVWSEAASILVRVPNRAPSLAPLPSRVVGDRVEGATLDITATDPDGDALTGAGLRTFRLDALGVRVEEIVVRDGYGGEARGNVTVEIVNLAPRVAIRGLEALRAEREGTLAARASDADGPTPRIAWTLDGRALGDAPELVVRLNAGEHEVRLAATDAEGATSEARATFTLAAEAPPVIERAATEAGSPTPSPEPARAPAPPPKPAPEPILVQPAPSKTQPEPVAQASVTLVEPARETPLPAWTLVAALAALAATRRRRAR